MATICFPFAGDTVGGSYISVLGLIKNLDRSLYRPLIVPRRPDGAVAALFRDHGISVDETEEWTNLAHLDRMGPRALLGAASALAPQVRFLRRSGVDIVHTNDGRTHATWGLAARIAGAKLLWHHRADPNAKGLRFAAPLLAHQVVAVSRFASPPAGRYSAARKTEVVHSPFDTRVEEDRATARADLLAELEAPNDAVLIGYFGTFVSRKRPVLFIDAIKRIRKHANGRPVYGLMFGTDQGMESQMRDRITELCLEGSVHLMGWRTQGSRWIAGCDQLLMPGVGEPFGRVLIEAMLVGTPIVATRSGGNVEALKDGELGLLVPPEDAAGLAEASLSLIQHPDAARSFADKAQADARVRFGEQRHTALIQQIYARLLADRGAEASA